MPGALSGIKVLEFSEYIAGPFAGMLLSDLGADVIKIEPPGGEPWRHASPFIPNESRNFISLNRGKRSLPLDLKRPEAREIVYKLLEDTDVVLVNARPDVAARLGIDYDTLSAKRPGLVYCDNTAFGRTGPDRHRPGYDLIAQAVTGLMASEAKTEDGLPLRIQSTPVADFATGMAMAWGICAALYHRERTGRGQMVETTLLGTALAFQTMVFTQVEAIDQGPRTGFLDTLDGLRDSAAPFRRDHRGVPAAAVPLEGARPLLPRLPGERRRDRRGLPEPAASPAATGSPRTGRPQIPARIRPGDRRRRRSRRRPRRARPACLHGQDSVRLARHLRSARACPQLP